MAKVVGIHGVGHQYQGEQIVYERWFPALKSGLALAGVRDFADDDLRCAFYGDIYRAQVSPAAAPRGAQQDAEILDPWEEEMLELWAQAADQTAGGAEGEPGISPAATPTPRGAPNFVQGSLRRLSRSKFFAGVAENALILDLKQVRLYLHDDGFRNRIQTRVAQAIAPDTRVVIGHSLGSIVAYESVCAHPEWGVTTLITLGSPLGIQNLIFDKLEPTPAEGVGIWPPSVERWINIADEDDVVALVKRLAEGFGDNVQDVLVENGASAHRAASYLTARQTGEAVAGGL